ncbi:MAG: radical SAM protein [Lachnospiraceae bacterium]|nr:radical SAM protein [Butyrivibrio sp.]MCM1342422.1 radical SAM protein [Muribaculaceae bacterium]MCM1410271.1 radical SAM protein [Lachnospiraceae bacterium]
MWKNMNLFLQNELEQFKAAEKDQEKGEISEKIRNALQGKKIVIYGAGATGKALADVFAQLNIKIAFYVDRKSGDIKEINGIPVFGVEKLQQHNEKNILVIVSIDTQLFLEFQDEIERNINKFCPQSVVIPYGRDLILALRYGICRDRFLSGHEFEIVECINCGAENRRCEIFDEYLKKLASKSVLDKSGYKLKYNKFFGYILSNICSLKCKHCCEMVPYYNEKAFVKADVVVENCRKIADACQFTMYIELIGGEPFLHPEIAYILEELLKIDDVGYVKIFTNGTVVPDAQLCKVLKNPRIVVVWSNYQDTLQGILLDNVNKTREIFAKEGIKYIYSMSKTWLDFSSFDYVNKSEEDLENDFEDCFIANCHRLFEGVLYRCPHQYAAARLNKIDVGENDCVNIEECASLEELSEKLYHFKNLRYVDACRYCVVPYKAQEVPAGEQLGEEENEILPG